METNLIITYGLIALLLAGAAWAVYARHNTLDRRIKRQRRRDKAYREKRDAQQ